MVGQFIADSFIHTIRWQFMPPLKSASRRFQFRQTQVNKVFFLFVSAIHLFEIEHQNHGTADFAFAYIY